MSCLLGSLMVGMLVRRVVAEWKMVACARLLKMVREGRRRVSCKLHLHLEAVSLSAAGKQQMMPAGL